MYKDCWFCVLGFSDIIGIIKFRFLSKYHKAIADEYITKNEKACDMQAYSCGYLMTPEYLVIRFWTCTDGDISRKIKNRAKNIKNNIIKPLCAYETDIIIDHINNHCNTLRLAKFSTFDHVNTSLRLSVCHMPNLKYIDTVRNFPLVSIDTPSIKYCWGTILNPEYKVKTTFMNDIIFNAYNDFTENVLIYNLKYINLLLELNNCKRLYIYCGELWPKQISREKFYMKIHYIYIESCDFGSTNILDIFPNLRKIYIGLYNIIYINGIKISLYYVENRHEKITEVDNEKTVQNNVFNNIEKIKICKFISGLDLAKIFPNLKKIYISSNIFNFKLHGLQIKNMIMRDKLKKLIFSD